MGGFDASKLIDALNVPATHEPVIVMAIGYPGEADILPEHLKVRELAPRERYLQEVFVRNAVFEKE